MRLFGCNTRKLLNILNLFLNNNIYFLVPTRYVDRSHIHVSPHRHGVPVGMLHVRNSDMVAVVHTGRGKLPCNRLLHSPLAPTPTAKCIHGNDFDLMILFQSNLVLFLKQNRESYKMLSKYRSKTVFAVTVQILKFLLLFI